MEEVVRSIPTTCTVLNHLQMPRNPIAAECLLLSVPERAITKFRKSLNFRPEGERDAKCRRSLKENLEAFGERDAQKRRVAISMIWETYIV